MMLIPTQNPTPLTFIFKIPNISKLLIFKDNWSNNKVMDKVIVELLRARQFEPLYLGNVNENRDLSNFYNSEDSAVIALTISDVDVAEITTSVAAELFSRELKNKKNRFLFENNLICSQKNITTIQISIRVQAIRRDEIANFQAA